MLSESNINCHGEQIVIYPCTRTTIVLSYRIPTTAIALTSVTSQEGTIPGRVILQGSLIE